MPIMTRPLKGSFPCGTSVLELRFCPAKGQCDHPTLGFRHASAVRESHADQAGREPEGPSRGCRVGGEGSGDSSRRAAGQSFGVTSRQNETPECLEHSGVDFSIASSLGLDSLDDTPPSTLLARRVLPAFLAWLRARLMKVSDLDMKSFPISSM